MGEESKPSPKHAKRAKPGPPAHAPATKPQDKKAAANVDLISFTPTAAFRDDQPANGTDTDELTRRRIARLTERAERARAERAELASAASSRSASRR